MHALRSQAGTVVAREIGGDAGDVRRLATLPAMTRPDGLALLGTWHLGSVSAAAWTQAGISVVAWDPDPEVQASLRAGRAPVAEAGVDDALTAALESGLLRVVDDARKAVATASVTQLAIDTQVDERGSPADERLDEAVSCFAAAAPDSALLVVSSQLAVGTSGRWREQLEREQRGLLVAHVPENLRLGSAFRDFTQPPRLIIGADDDEAFRRAAALFGVVGTPPTRLSLVSAEMSKHATNAYLALCVAFANDLAWLSLSVGADPGEVAAALRDDPRVSPSAPLRPGTAFSGATLMRDLMVLRDLGARCGRPDLFEAVIRANERHAEVALAWLEDSLGSLAGRRVAVVGLTYKPGTSTLRDSLPLKLVGQLLERGATVAAWDPAAEPFDPPAGFTRAASLEESVEGADALAVMTALPQLENVDWGKLRPAHRLVIDGCMAVDRDAAESAGWSYRGLARGQATVASP
jgi:UDPglucose 6-dehydrogenase